MRMPLLAVMLLAFERCGAPQPCPTAKEEEEIRMSSRPLPVTVAAILLVLLSLFNFPWVYELFFPGAEGPPAALLYSGYVVGVVGLLPPSDYGCFKSGATGPPWLFVRSTSFWERRE